MIVHARTPEQKEQLLAYAAQRIGYEPRALVGDMPYHAVGSIRDGRLMGAVVFMNWRRHSLEWHVAGQPGWLSRADLRELFSYAFVHCKCLRLWCLVARNNKRTRGFAERLGFKVKCVLDDEFGEHKDGIIYSMKRGDCKWI